jgi:putative spermidine/putrescine transport system substrate-binding protein
MSYRTRVFFSEEKNQKTFESARAQRSGIWPERWKRARKLAVLPLACVLMAAAPPAVTDPDAPQPVSVAIRAGAPRDAAVKVLVKPYADATGTALDVQPLDGAAKTDLALVDGATLTAGCKAHLFMRLDFSGLGRDRFLAPAASDCGAGAYIGATLLAWDQTKLHAIPSWGDFWDVAKIPGRRGLQKTARRNLEFALMADGVAPGDVYRTLRSADGIDRAFRKLDQLKPYVEWWDQPGQPGQFLMSGKVLMTTAPSSMLPSGGKPHLGIQWGGCLDEVTSWAVPAKAAHARGAMAVIGIATDAARQADFAKATGLGPATKPGFALLPEAARGASPASPAHLQGCVPVDEGFWSDNGDKLDARFAAWLVK